MIVLYILLYIIPVVIILYGGYLSMHKGETLEHYLNRRDLDDVFWVLSLFPAFNWIMAIFVIFDVVFKAVWNKIKYWKK